LNTSQPVGWYDHREPCDAAIAKLNGVQQRQPSAQFDLAGFCG
jgi:hypothetical protein